MNIITSYYPLQLSSHLKTECWNYAEYTNVRGRLPFKATEERKNWSLNRNKRRLVCCVCFRSDSNTQCTDWKHKAFLLQTNEADMENVKIMCQLISHSHCSVVAVWLLVMNSWQGQMVSLSMAVHRIYLSSWITTMLCISRRVLRKCSFPCTHSRLKFIQMARMTATNVRYQRTTGSILV